MINTAYDSNLVEARDFSKSFSVIFLLSFFSNLFTCRNGDAIYIKRLRLCLVKCTSRLIWRRKLQKYRVNFIEGQNFFCSFCRKKGSKELRRVLIHETQRKISGFRRWKSVIWTRMKVVFQDLKEELDVERETKKLKSSECQWKKSEMQSFH